MDGLSAWIVRGTIWLAIALFVAAEYGRQRAGRHQRPVPWALPTFALGALFCAVHFLAAFHWHHEWSHTRAIEFTARQTAEVYGLDWGGGLWVNYVFLGAWLVEIVRWARDPSHETRAPGKATWALRAFYAVILVNAAVVFPGGPARLLGTVLLGLLGFFWIRR